MSISRATDPPTSVEVHHIVYTGNMRRSCEILLQNLQSCECREVSRKPLLAGSFQRTELVPHMIRGGQRRLTLSAPWVCVPLRVRRLHSGNGEVESEFMHAHVHKMFGDASKLGSQSHDLADKCKRSLRSRRLCRHQRQQVMSEWQQTRSDCACQNLEDQIPQGLSSRSPLLPLPSAALAR